MEELRIELLNCFGNNNLKLKTVIESIDFSKIETAIEIFSFFQNIMIFPSGKKLKVFGRLKNIPFTNKEKESLLKQYNGIRVKEYIKKEAFTKFLGENEWMKETLLVQSLQERVDYLDNDGNSNCKVIKKEDTPIDLRILINKLEELFNEKASIFFNDAKKYDLVIDLYKLSFTENELASFLSILNRIKKNSENKIEFVAKYDFENEDDNNKGIVIIIRVDKSFFKEIKDEKMLIFLENGKIKNNKLDVPKLYCNYDYQNYKECDSQILNDFIICNYYQYKENITYSDTILKKIDSSLFIINSCNKYEDKLKIILREDIKFYARLSYTNNNGETITVEKYFANHLKTQSRTIDDTTSNLAELCLNNEYEFDFNKKHYFIEDKIFFGEKIVDSNNKICYVSKTSQISKLFVVNQIGKGKEYESVTYVIRFNNGNLVYINGYYNTYLDRYYILSNNIEEIIDEIEIDLCWPELKIIANNSCIEDKWTYSTRSKLSLYGYSVMEGVSKGKRQTALIKALEGGMTKNEIESFLRWLLFIHKNNKRFEKANTKRIEDLEFLENYNIDKQRKVNLN